MTEVLRYAAFTDDPRGGNPAGVVLDASLLDEAQMLAIAAEVGYSETAFLVADGAATFDVRYFAPSAEVAFCGHATIATGVVLAQRHGPGRFLLRTKAGSVHLDVERSSSGGFVSTLTSVEPAITEISDDDVRALLDVFRWPATDLDLALPPRIAYAGVWHPIIAAATRERLADLNYDFDGLRELMLARGWTTIQLVWRESQHLFHVRDPFPVGGVVEDPATGAAAAAFGHYLRELRLIEPPARLTLHQGDDLGRPSVLTVDVEAAEPRIRVSGAAVEIPA
ncbi:MAG TPA: PhzF family phenazine biosynthesis isomerase [Acidothermaceae bacterium]|nr:PhzF family phenazine biosynthesis isomerase [Acidothermaceae bacterium]